MHYAVEVPIGKSGKALQNWIGGYYETGWSINPHWIAESRLNKNHPITRGVNNFKVKEFNFLDKASKFIPSLGCSSLLKSISAFLDFIL